MDLVENFIFIKKFKDRHIKIMARWMQFKAANRIFERVTKEKDKKLGLIWHWQGSGKSLTMAFTSWKLFRHVKLEQPTIFLVLDRRDLQKQIVEEEFHSIGIHAEVVKTTKQLVNILKWGGRERKGKRGIFVCLIQKFSPKKLKKLHDEGEINLDRENIVIFTDESHRSQYGTLATTMRGIFNNAFIFGFTGTPLTKPERNTFTKFSPEGELYLDRFGMLDSIKNGFTLPIRYEARLPEVHIKPEEIEELGKYEEEVLEELTEEERKIWKRKIRPKIALLKSEERVEKICKDIAEYFKSRVEKTGFKAMVAVVDRECCVLFKQKLDELLGEKYCEIVMTYQAKEKKSKILQEYRENITRRFKHSDFDKINEEIVSQFRNEEFPKILIVSDMLLTGFDAKNLWVLFLYKPLKEHRLLQAITRTNRPYPNKEFGLVIDYIGVAEYLEEALEMFETEFLNEARLFIRKLEESEKEFEKLINELKSMFSGMEIRDIKDIDKAVEFLILNDVEDEFLSKIRKLRRLYELLSPSEVTFKYADVYGIFTSIEITLRRYRKRELRLEEVEKMARKTYELIQKTIGVDKIEKIGEIEVNKELEKLEKEKRPIAAIRVISEVSRRVYGRKGDFYVSIRKDIEKIYRELKTKKVVTKEIIERLRQLNEKIAKREMERKQFGKVYPIFEVLKNHFDKGKALEVSKEIFNALNSKGLLKKDNFFKESRRRKIR